MAELGPYIVVMDRSEADTRTAYYCKSCKQLRSGKPLEKTEKCGVCNSSDIVVEKIDTEGMKKLYLLRFGTETPFGIRPP